MRDSVKIMSNWLESFKDTCTEEQLKEICYRINLPEEGKNRIRG